MTVLPSNWEAHSTLIGATKMTIRMHSWPMAAVATVLLLISSAKAGDSNGNFQIKAGVSGVVWQDQNNGISINNGAPVAGAGASARDIVLPTATLTYFATRNVAFELFCCFAHATVAAKGTLAALGNVADTWTFPPILTLQYHFDGLGAIKPYVGVGAEWIHYFDSRSKISAFNKVKFDDSFGLALQAGVDYDLGRGWSAGVDVKKVFEDTNITWTNASSSTIRTNHDLDPLILTANFGYRFNLQDILEAK